MDFFRLCQCDEATSDTCKLMTIFRLGFPRILLASRKANNINFGEALFLTRMSLSIMITDDHFYSN